jgi:hypothetical protein
MTDTRPSGTPPGREGVQGRTAAARTRARTPRTRLRPPVQMSDRSTHHSSGRTVRLRTPPIRSCRTRAGPKRLLRLIHSGQVLCHGGRAVRCQADRGLDSGLRHLGNRACRARHRGTRLGHRSGQPALRKRPDWVSSRDPSVAFPPKSEALSGGTQTGGGAGRPPSRPANATFEFLSGVSVSVLPYSPFPCPTHVSPAGIAPPSGWDSVHSVDARVRSERLPTFRVRGDPRRRGEGPPRSLPN